MIAEAIIRLNNILDKAPNLLMEISEENMSMKPSPKKWSKKEVIGHLIDSATNNHHRLVRGQFELKPEIVYDQDKWNEFNFYQEIDSAQLINFWTIYNRQLIELIKQIPKGNLTNEINVGYKNVTFELLIVEYVEHLEHHLKQLINY